MNPFRPVPFHWRPATMVIAACAALSACQPADEGDAVNEAAANEAAATIPTVPLPAAPMGRAELLTAVAEAASSTAAGTPNVEAQRSLDGKRFELRIRFGCRGPAADFSDAAFGWTRNREDGTLRVRATPTVSLDNQIVAKVAGEDVEAAEGFWIPRPWLLQPICPAGAAVRPAAAATTQEGEAAPGEEQDARAADGDAATARPRQAQEPSEDIQETESPPPAFPKVGIAQFFTATDSRTQRRAMRPYEVVQILPPDQPLTSQGFNLVLSGRLSALPGKGVIHCVSRGPDAPPDCLISANIDQVWIERPDTKEILAEWGSG